jgi:YidC/Oxa1 family membrane protein insertase
MSAKGFDKNSIIGLVLIGAILLVFSIMSSPSEEELQAKKEEQKKKEKAKTEQVDKNENVVLPVLLIVQQQ